jgi:anti-sigma B factor antagonist
VPYILAGRPPALGRWGPETAGKTEGDHLSLSISEETRNGTTVIHVGGDLDVYTAPRLKESLDAAISAAHHVVLDLSEVQFIDSTALGVLVGAHQAAHSENGKFHLVVSDPFLLKIFHITGFDGIFSIHAEVEDALAGR